MTELAQLGHDVDVVFSKSDVVDRELRQQISDYYGLGTLPDSINFVPVGSGRTRGALHEARADIRNVIYARRNKRELVHTRDPFALTLALAAGLHCVFETYRVDINEDAKFGPWRAVNYHRQNLVGVVTHSDLCRRSFIKAGMPEARVTTNYNGYSPTHFTPPITREAARARLGLGAMDRIATYTGHVDITKGIAFLVRVAQQIPDVIFLLIGAAAGSEEEGTLVSLIQKTDARNIRPLPRVTPAEVSMYLFASDCLIIPPTAAPFREHHRTVLPMKTFSYLAAGRPIVAPDLPDLREVLRHNENALLVSPDNVDAAVAAIRSAVFDRPLGERLGSVAQRDAAQYTWRARAERFSTLLQNVGAAEDAG
jgi:glycosyltransferase involved in cell wall biosynthesis